MRKFITDQILFFAIGLAIMIGIPFFCGPIFTLLLEMIAIVSWGYLCRQLLLLPLDLICGKVTRSVCFSSQCGVGDYEFYFHQHYCEWKFYYGNEQTIT